MKETSLLEALCRLVKDCAEQCSTPASRDIQEIRMRVAHEGLSFLTITLPSFSKDFFKCLENRRVSTDLFLGWKKRRGLPEFLRGFLCQCFDATTGEVIDGQHIVIQSVRQICNFYKKILLDCTPERTKNAFQKYCRTDDDLSGVNPMDLQGTFLKDYRSISRIIVGTLFPDDINPYELIPHHGPGATVEKVSGNQKFCSPDITWPSRLEKAGFGPDMMYSSEECYHNSPVNFPSIDESSELAVRVISVPKTLKTPRIIAIEPVAMQFAQQSLKDLIVERIDRCDITSGHINFIDQSINQRLAIQSSLDGKLASLDLEEASDRIPNWCSQILFEVNPTLNMLIQACRSRNAILPDGTKISLWKFSSMGSALCFPVEALHFFVLLIMAGLRQRNLNVTVKNIKCLRRDVYVYGDDIFCPVDWVDSVIDVFQNFGSKVNRDKSFYNGNFRESCGKDAYAGLDITPTYARRPFPTRKRDASAIISWVATANQLLLKGYLGCYRYIQEMVETITGPLPSVDNQCSGIGWIDGERRGKRRLHPSYHSVQVRTLVPRVKYKIDKLDGYGALAKCLTMLTRSKTCTAGNEHLERTAVTGAVRLQSQWVDL